MGQSLGCLFSLVVLFEVWYGQVGWGKVGSGPVRYGKVSSIYNSLVRVIGSFLSRVR